MAPDVAFGPEGNQWLYNREAQLYDLGRGSESSFTFATTHGHEGTSVSLDPARTALVVVDMQNFFLHPSCRAHPAGLDAVQPTADVVGKCRTLGIEARRACSSLPRAFSLSLSLRDTPELGRGGPPYDHCTHVESSTAPPSTAQDSRLTVATAGQIVWLNWGLTDADLASMPAAITRSFAASSIHPPPNLSHPPWPGLGNDMGDGKGRCLFAGSWNAAIYEPLLQVVRPEDAHCAKNRMSGMWSPEQPLWKHLEQRGIRSVLFGGVNTDQCVLGTLTDAYNAGWDCVLVDDCAATTTPGAKEVCAANMAVSLFPYVGRTRIELTKNKRTEKQANGVMRWRNALVS
jgi:nicotinamidase-related amidase